MEEAFDIMTIGFIFESAQVAAAFRRLNSCALGSSVLAAVSYEQHDVHPIAKTIALYPIN